MAGSTPDLSADQTRHTLTGRRALIVQGDGRDRQHLAEYLSGWGIQIEVTANPLEGLAFLWRGLEQSLPFDFTLFGTSGHGVSSDQFAALVRSDPRLAGMPMLHIGVNGGTARRVALRKAGFFDTVAMPVNKTWLFATLHRACGVDATADGVARLLDRHRVTAPTLPRLEVLIAEPDPEQRRILRSALKRGGHALFEVETGEQALEALAKHSFDLVIISLNLPGLGTSDALKLYRFSVLRQDWPAFIGLAREPTMTQVRDFAAVGVTVIPSPVAGPDLLRTIAEVVHEGGNAGRLSLASLASATDETSKVVYLDERVLREIEQIGSHPNFLYELIQEFLTEVGTLLEAVLETRGSTQCYLRLREFGHVLQDNAGSVGALQLYHLGLVAAQYPETLFKQDEGQLLDRIAAAYHQTRDAFWRYLEQRSLSRSPTWDAER